MYGSISIYQLEITAVSWYAFYCMRNIGIRNRAKRREGGKKIKKERNGQMICEKCGQWIEEGSKTCSKCGAPVGANNGQNANAAASVGNTAPVGGQPGAGGFGANAGQGVQMPMTKDEFYKHPNIASVRSQIRGAGILCYVVAGISLVLSFLSGNPFGALLDVLLIVGLGLGIQLGKSRVCAIILTVYGAFNTIIITLANGALGGWWILLAGIYAIIYTFKYQSAWAEYQNTGIVKDFSQGKKK